MDGRTLAWQDQERAWLTDTIRRHGWALQYIGGGLCSHPDCSGEDEGPPFAYTVGLFGMGHAELLVFSLPLDAACHVLDGFGEKVRNGENLIPGREVTLEGHHHRFVPEVVPNPGEIVLWANDFYQRPAEFSVPVLQLSYDDGTGVYPWEEGYAAPEAQPRPGSFRA